MRKIIIFDLDNTFYNYENSHNAGLKAVFSSQKEFDDYEKFFIKYEQTKKKVQKRLLKRAKTGTPNSTIFVLF